MAKGKYEYWISKEGLTLITGWARQGLIDKQIAHNMNITLETFYQWKKKFSEFSDALKKGKEVADFEVENALFIAANGYWTEETTIEELPVDGQIIVRRKTVKKFVPPNTTAQIFWLKNRKVDTWKDKREEKIETSDNSITVKFSDDLDGYAD